MVTKREIVFVSMLLLGGIGLYFGYANLKMNEKVSDLVVLSYDEALQRLPGFYSGIETESGKTTSDIFFITADLEFYRLTKTQVKHAREYVGSIDLADFSLKKDGSFKFYSYAGTPIAQGDLPNLDQFLPLAEVNSLCKELIKVLNTEGLELSLRLDRDKPDFTAVQKALLSKLIEHKTDLVSYMKGRGYETLWINDYLNERLYVLDGYLIIPAALTESPETIIAGLADGSYVPDSME
jgi:hypothetical protein